jgi:hypothetical protein
VQATVRSLLVWVVRLRFTVNVHKEKSQINAGRIYRMMKGENHPVFI